MASTYELIIKAVDQTSGPLRRTEQGLKSVERQAERVNTSIRGVGTAIAAFATGSIVRGIVGVTARFEDLRDTLDVVTGSARRGSQAFSFIQDFATRTQFGVEELTTTFIKLQGAGITPTEKLLTTFTDTAAVTTDQLGTLEAMTDLFSRTISGGLGLEELNRLADRGVPVFAILERQLGLTKLEVSEFGKTAEGANRIREALTRGLNESFGGATQGKVDNLSTAMSNFGIAVKNAAAQIGEGLRPQLTQAINDATNFIQTNEALLKALGTDLGQAIGVASQSLQFLAQNFEVIKNAALALIFTRIAASVATLVTRIAQFTAGAKGFAGFFSGAGKAISATVGGLGRFVGTLTGLGPIMTRLAPLLTNPFTAIPAAIAAAVAGGLWYFRDEVIKINNVTGTLGEYTRAAFQLIGEQAQKAVTYLRETFFGGFFDRFESMAGTAKDWILWAWEAIGAKTKIVVNFISNAFIAMGETVIGVAKNIPEFFGAAFDAVMIAAGDLVTAMSQKFTNLKQAMQLALSGDFAEAIAKAGEDVGYSFTESFASAFSNLPNLTEGIDYAGIFGTDRVGQGMEALREGAAALRVTITDWTAPAMEALSARVAENQQAAAAAAASMAHYDDAILRVARAQEAAAIGTETTTNALRTQAAELTGYAKFYNDLINASRETVTEQEYTARAVDQLNVALRNGSISVDMYAAAMQRLGVESRNATASFSEQLSILREKLNIDIAQTATNRQLLAQIGEEYGLQSEQYKLAQQQLGLVPARQAAAAKQLTASQQIVESMQREQTQLKDLEAALANVSEIARAAGVSEAVLTRRLQEQIKSLRENKGEVQSLSQSIQEYWKQTSGQFASTLANDIVEGKNVLSSFKDFFKQTLKDIARMIIEQQITKPLMNEISQLFGMIGGGGGMMGGFGGGMMGGGGFLSGLFGGGGGFFSNIFSGIGNWFSGLWGGVSNFFGGLFGFANGGVPPANKPSIVGEKGPELFIPGTTGRVVPNDELNTGGALNVTFQINAIDQKSGAEFIIDNKDQIVGVINDAYARRGKVGIY